MNKVVLVNLKNEYGIERVYPANDNAECLAAIADTITLTPRTLRYAAQLGLEIQLAERDIQDLASILPWTHPHPREGGRDDTL